MGWNVYNSSGNLKTQDDGPSIYSGGQVAAFIGLNAATQSVPDSTWTQLQADAYGAHPVSGGMESDPYGMADLVNYRITAPFTGIYMISVSARWDGNTTGRRYYAIQKNTAGTYTYANTLARQNWYASEQPAQTDMKSWSYFGRLNANDHVEMFVHQDSGAPRNVHGSANVPFEQWSGSSFGIALIQRLL